MVTTNLRSISSFESYLVGEKKIEFENGELKDKNKDKQKTQPLIRRKLLVRDGTKGIRPTKRYDFALSYINYLGKRNIEDNVIRDLLLSFFSMDFEYKFNKFGYTTSYEYFYILTKKIKKYERFVNLNEYNYYNFFSRLLIKFDAIISANNVDKNVDVEDVNGLLLVLFADYLVQEDYDFVGELLLLSKSEKLELLRVKRDSFTKPSFKSIISLLTVMSCIEQFDFYEDFVKNIVALVTLLSADRDLGSTVEEILFAFSNSLLAIINSLPHKEMIISEKNTVIEDFFFDEENVKVIDSKTIERTVMIKKNAIFDSNKDKVKSKYNNKCFLSSVRNCEGTWCIMDSDKPVLEVHHIIPKRFESKFPNGDIHQEWNLIPLCPNCHKFIHFQKNKFTDEQYICAIEKILSTNDRIAKELKNFPFDGSNTMSAGSMLMCIYEGSDFDE